MNYNNLWQGRNSLKISHLSQGEADGERSDSCLVPLTIRRKSFICNGLWRKMTDPSESVLQRAIIIVGAPRSGTTFLGNLLKHHPRLAYLEEPRLTWRYGNDHRSDMLKASDARPDVCAHIRRIFAQAVRSAGRERLLEKTPSNALRLAFVDQVLPECQFVHILRNGVQSALSIRKYWEAHARGIPTRKLAQRLREITWRRAPHYLREMARRTLPRRLETWAGRPVWGPRIPGIDGLLRDLDLLEVCCIQWRMSVEAACQFGRRLPSHRYFECRLESFSPDTVRSILRFCGLEESDEVWAAFHAAFDPSLPASRSETAAEDELQVIRQWIEPTLKWLEYELDNAN
jgi:hypothetical protein